MTGTRLCLAIDLGTGGPKVGLVTLDGRIVARTHQTMVTEFGADGAAVQDATRWWALIGASARSLLAEDPSRASDVVAVAVTGQWASTVPVDVEGRPTGPCLTWQDQRGGPYVRDRIGGRLGGYRPAAIASWVRRTAGAPSLAGADPVGHLLYLKHAAPEQFERTRWCLEPVDYLTMCFTGRASASHASMQGAWLIDTRTLDRYSYDPVLLRYLGLTQEKLPPLAPIGSVIGTVQPSVAAQLGLGDEVVVITGLPDLQSAALGAGATRPLAAHLALSTTSWISCPVSAKKTDIFHMIATVPGLTNDSYLMADNQETGAKSLEWLRTVVGPRDAPLSYDALTALAGTAEPGAGGVAFMPWLAGERSPVEDHSARGGFTNLSVTTGAADLARSVLEGVAFNSKWLLGSVERFAGRPLSPIRMVGGGAESDLWCQIYADVLDRPIERVPDPTFAQMRGMALMAGAALGEHRLDEIDQLVPAGRLFPPDRANVAVYRSRAEELPALFRAMRRHRHRDRRRRARAR
jgi:xylulokinase